MVAMMVSKGWVVVEQKSSLITDKCGEVATLRLERAMGIQGIPPSLELALYLKVTSWTSGNLEKSKDCSKVPRVFGPGNGVGVNIPR